jgi:hypothetical protein
MKRRIIGCIVVLLITAAAAIAQPPDPEKREQMVESLRIAYVTKQLELTPEEAQKFWPVYNNYSKDVKKVLEEGKVKKDQLVVEENMLNLRKRYRTEFLKAIPEEKFNRFLQADRNFKDMLRRELDRRQQEGNRMPQRRGGGGIQ